MADTKLSRVPFSRPTIDPLQWHEKPIPVRRWITDDLLPYLVVTMLSGDGGLGKSTLALQWAIAAATGTEFLGRKVEAVRVLIVACEDDPDELHRRIYDILVHQNMGFQDLENIKIIPGAGFDNVLVNFDDYSSAGKITEFCEFVAAEALAFGAQFIILDSLHDFFAGNENARPQARQFINQLRKIAIDLNGAVLLLAHPSLSGLRDKTGSAGSTAWSNTVRSRLYLSKEENGSLTLKTMKANYAANGGVIRLEYRKGCFYNLDGNPDPNPVYHQVQVDDVFITCLRAAYDRGERVTTSKSGNYAPKVFAGMKSINRSFGVKEFEAAMTRLLDDRRIIIGPVKDAGRNVRPGLVENVPENQPENEPDETSLSGRSSYVD